VACKGVYFDATSTAVTRPEPDRKCRRADRHTPTVMRPSDPSAVLADMKRTEAAAA